MSIEYTFEKKFSKEDTFRLFKSINWYSANFPERLHKALMNSQTVVTAWNGNKLVGLARALDDGEMVAFIHYVLVDPEYQGHHIASTLIKMIKEKYQAIFISMLCLRIKITVLSMRSQALRLCLMALL